jgi:multidrug efflux pump subunit AcrA (membrane-fusion protein)
VQNVGELAEAGVGRKPIFKLAEIETLYVEALLPAHAYRHVKIGMVGRVVPAAPEGSVKRAKVTVIDRVLDAGSATFGARLELPNNDGRLLAGVRRKLSFASVKVDPLPPAPWIPSATAPSRARRKSRSQNSVHAHAGWPVHLRPQRL